MENRKNPMMKSRLMNGSDKRLAMIQNTIREL